jgi:hypothetical protein
VVIVVVAHKPQPLPHGITTYITSTCASVAAITIVAHNNKTLLLTQQTPNMVLNYPKMTIVNKLLPCLKSTPPAPTCSILVPRMFPMSPQMMEMYSQPFPNMLLITYITKWCIQREICVTFMMEFSHTSHQVLELKAVFVKSSHSGLNFLEYFSSPLSAYFMEGCPSVYIHFASFYLRFIV